MPPATAGRPAGRSAASTRQHLLELLRPVVTTAGYELEDLTVTAAGRRSVLRVVVDRDGGVDLDAVAEVSRAVSAALDANTPGGAAFAGPYVLEVSSPGVDRPLTEPRHWRRAVGRLVQASLADESVTGRIVRTDEHGVQLEVSGRVRELAWSELRRGRVQIEFNRSADVSEQEG